MATYKKGSKGEVVKKIQQALMKALLNLKLEVDGVYGPNTEKAVKAYQRTKMLKVDGIAGPKTLESLGITVEQFAPKPEKPKMLVPKKSKRMINEIIVHCTATPEGVNKTVEEIRAIHTAPVSKGGRGWKDIGYHYLISLDGTVYEGKNVDEIGSHCSKHNLYSVGVVYVGGVENKPGVPYAQLQPKDTRTKEQKEALIDFLKELKKLYPKAKIYGHRDFANKACPCFDAKKEYADL